MNHEWLPRNSLYHVTSSMTRIWYTDHSQPHCSGQVCKNFKRYKKNYSDRYCLSVQIVWHKLAVGPFGGQYRHLTGPAGVGLVLHLLLLPTRLPSSVSLLAWILGSVSKLVFLLKRISWARCSASPGVDSISSRFNGTNQYAHFNDCTDKTLKPMFDQ
jgi:hypothetical protein